MKSGVRSQKSEVRIAGFGIRGSGFRLRGGPWTWLLLVFLLTPDSWLLTSAFAATHVTATYDLGANPQVMTTVGGQPQYGLVFAQRNKTVTYNSVEYTPSVVKGYLNASGVLNDRAGNLWLDLIPNLGATPADSYYVVTFNIQGRVHAEIWVLPDVGSVAAETVRQAQPPSSTSSGFDLSIATGLLALAHGGTGQSSWTAGRCVRVNNAGSALESATADCGTGGGGSSHDILSATHSDTNAAAASRGALMTGQGVSPTRWTIMPKGAQFCVIQAGALDLVCEPVDLTQAAAVTGILGSTNGGTSSSYVAFTGPTNTVKTFTLPNFNATLEYQANKNAASGYAGLTAGTKLNAAQGQEVWSSADLTDFAGKSGTGTTILGATITSPTSTHYLGWGGSDWVNRALAAGDLPSHNHAAGDINSGTFGFARGGTNQTGWTASRCVRVNDAGTALESAAADCGTGGGGGDNVSVNGTAATDADLDDATPSAPASAINVKWQKDALTPNNVSAYVSYAAPLTVSGGNLTAVTSPASAATVVGTGRTLTGGAGIAAIGDLSADRTIDVASQEAGFLADGGTTSLTCGSNNQGKAQVMDNGQFQACDGATTSVLQTFGPQVAAGSNGIAAYNAGDDTTAARSDHTHRSLHALTWFFPGTPASGVAAMTLMLPGGITNPSITDMRVTVNTTSASSSAFNIQRCTATCTGAATFADIYSSNLTLSANVRTVAKGSAPNQNVSGLAAGDQFKADLTTIGASLADVTVTMTVKYETTN